MGDAEAGNREYMNRAIDLARRCESEEGSVSPKVGALVVLDGRVLAESYRGEFAPGEHAEFTLLERRLAGQSLEGATLFTTLEPCSARNPPKIPCADRIIERGVRTVVMATLDHNPEIRGKGELRLQDSGVAIARFDSDLVRQVVQLNEEFVERHRPSIQARIPSQTSDPVRPGEVGPNGYAVEYTKDGDKVEWIPEEEAPDGRWALLLRRNDKAILEQQEEFWDKVWYNRKLIWLERGRELPDGSSEAMREIEERYGRENLVFSDFEWGLLSGRLSALAWVMGAEWDESLDT